MQLILVNLLYPLFLHPKPRLLLRTYHDSKILQFDNESSFLLKIHVIFYCQYAKFRHAAYEKVHLDLLQSFLKINLKIPSQLFTNLWKNFVVPNFVLFWVAAKMLAISFVFDMYLNISHFLLRQQPYSIWTITQDLIKLGAYNMSHSSLFKVSTNTQNETGCQCGRKQLRPGKIQIFFSKYLQN